MDVLCHINELETGGWSLLPSLMLFGNRIHFWAPSAILLQKAYDEGICRIRPEEFVQLVEERHVRVCAREDWLRNGDGRRKLAEHWPEAKWVPGFDDRLQQFYVDDGTPKSPGPNSRVYAHRDAVGYTQADRLIAQGHRKVAIARRLARAGHIPIGIQQSLNRRFNDNPGLTASEKLEISTRELLRHAIDLNIARSESAAALTVDTGLFDAELYNYLDGWKGQPAIGDSHGFSIEKLREAVGLARSLAGHEDLKSLVELRRKDSERQFFWNLVHSEQGARQELYDQIQNGKEKPGFWAQLLGRRYDDRVAAVAGCVLATTSIVDEMARPKGQETSRRRFLTGLGMSAGFALTSYSPLRQILESESILPEGDYSGPSWPFIFQIGQDNPTRQQIEELLSRLSQDL